MEKLTSLSNARAQGLEKIQALEAELGKLTNEMAALEASARTKSEEANQVKILGVFDFTQTPSVARMLTNLCFYNTKSSFTVVAMSCSSKTLI